MNISRVRLRTLAYGLILIVVAAFAVGCGEESELSAEQLEASMEDVITAQNRFGLALLRELSASAPDESIFISPLSVHMALSMAYNGAEGATADEMGQALHLATLARDRLNLAVRTQLAYFADEDLGVKLNVANGLWYAQELAFRSDYIASIEQYYQAAIAPLSFRNPESTAAINDWVSRQTEGLIPNLVDSLDPETIMLLVNAVYFKGDWSEPFDPALTQPHPFRLPTGAVKEVPMMYKDGQIAHYQSDRFEAIRLPYGDDERLAMYIFLPSEGVGLTEFVETLTYDNWETWIAGFQSKLGEVRLPRMELSYKTRLNTALKALGMGSAFDPTRAEFGAIRESGPGQNMYISDVVHQAVLKVDEEGTEAAAATSIGFRVTSMPMYAFRFVADRPFFAAVRDETTGAILFVGTVTDPAP